jgi:AcrR family transcriptional regulator
MTRLARADARRNHDRLVAAAREAFAAHGPDAPLDGIAQRAGLGSGTLYRHFPARETLLRAVYWSEIESMCAAGRELWESPDPAGALATWLGLLAQISGRGGLAAALMASMPDVPRQFVVDCHEAIRAAAAPLLRRAQEAGTVRADVVLTDLLSLTHAIARVAEAANDETDRAARLLSLLMDGVRSAQPGVR